jgi:GrpB-like predicted nucleotidyltransferase (UPF0157 family)
MPGLASTPVIDLTVAVRSEQAADACIARFEALGDQFRGPHGDDPRRRYCARDTGALRVAPLHLYLLRAAAWNEQLAFRGALRDSAPSRPAPGGVN